LGANDKNWYYNNYSAQPHYRLHNLLAPARRLVEARSKKYEEMITAEYNNGAAVNAVMAYRTKSMNNIKNLTSAQGSALEGDFIGAVAGYGEQVLEKYVGGPRIIPGSEVSIDKNEAGYDVILRNYFDQMKKTDLAQYQAIYEGIKNQLPSEIQEKFSIEALVTSFEK
jgi:hypothetical protein